MGSINSSINSLIANCNPINDKPKNSYEQFLERLSTEDYKSIFEKSKIEVDFEDKVDFDIIEDE